MIAMARPKKKPAYDAEKIMKELIAAVVDSYDETGELKFTAEEFDMSALKIRKLLITAGVYSNEISDEVNDLYESGKTIAEIRQITGLGKSSVNGYLPYTKAIYKPEELSLNAERINVFRSRQQAVRELADDMGEDKLWETIVAFQKYLFHTATGLPFVYELKKGRNRKYNGQLIVSRRTERKTVLWSSVRLAFQNAVDLQGGIVECPKALGDIRGISYIYPMLYRFGIIEVPEKIAKKMELRRPMPKQSRSGK